MDLMFILGGWLILICIIISVVSSGKMDPISQCEVDESICYQLRAQGLSEADIETHMNELGGGYTPPEDDK
jgi:hypothetical protein